MTKAEQGSLAPRKVALGHHAPGSTDTTADTGELPVANPTALADLATTTASSKEGDRTIPPHPLADIFPLLDDDGLRALAHDIGTHGLREDIVVYQGKILDGRCRYRACEIAGVMPSVTQYAGDNPLAFVVSHNLHRRHLNESQRAMVAARLADLQRGANQYSAGLPLGRAAKLMNVSERSAARAREVLVHGDRELVAVVESGNLTVAAAAALSRNQASASSDGTDVRLDSPTTSTNERSTPAEEPSPSTSTMVDAASVQAGFPSLATPPLGEDTCRPTFELPKPGVTFLVGGLKAAVLEVAVKIGATVAAGGQWPNYRYAESGEVVWLSSQSTAEAILRRQFEAAATTFLPLVRILEARLDCFGLSIRNLSDDLRRLDQRDCRGGTGQGCRPRSFLGIFPVRRHWTNNPQFRACD